MPLFSQLFLPFPCSDRCFVECSTIIFQDVIPVYPEQTLWFLGISSAFFLPQISSASSCLPFSALSRSSFLSRTCFWGIISESFCTHSQPLLCLFIPCFTQPFTDRVTVDHVEVRKKFHLYLEREREIIIQDFFSLFLLSDFGFFSEMEHCSRCLLEFQWHGKPLCCPSPGECVAAELGLYNIP